MPPTGDSTDGPRSFVQRVGCAPHSRGCAFTGSNTAVAIRDMIYGDASANTILGLGGNDIQAGRTQRGCDATFQRYDKFAITLSTGDTLVKETCVASDHEGCSGVLGSLVNAASAASWGSAAAQASVIAV